MDNMSEWFINRDSAQFRENALGWRRCNSNAARNRFVKTTGSHHELEIYFYGLQDLKILPEAIGSGGFSSVYVAYWKNTSVKYAIKKFKETSKEEEINNEIMKIASHHPNIIRFYGITKLQYENKYSLVLESADDGTLRDYLRNDAITFKWKEQLKFAKEIASAILWLHDDKGIVHQDLHPNNVLIHQNTIKLADFGRSSLKGTDCYNTEVWGIMPYVDPKALNRNIPYKINEKSDIYNLGFLFWELTSRKPSFDGLENDHITNKILSGKREEPVLDTNVKFIELYQKCWKHEPDERPNISQVNSELNSIDSKNNNASIVPYEREESKKTKFVHSCQIDLNKIYQQN
uniref:Protein kinase domain-containing protein n=1 Tax=Rhizophagus irregularis (strain DAOM 181602 / DAOM 197198 / MUCL 43194) TaxID=747089 RepID=U9TKA4_RHIID